MRGSKMSLMALALVAAAVSPAFAVAAPPAYRGSALSAMLHYRSIEGKVTAVDLKAQTIKIAAAQGSVTGPVSVMFTDRTFVHQGILHRMAENITVGEDVNVTYDGSGNKWVADNIDIRNPSVAVAHYLGNGAR